MEQMRIIVAGGSGFIGRHLIPALVADGHTVTVLTRAQPVQRVTPAGLLRYVHWDLLTSDGRLADVLASTDAVVNLAGANIGSRRWTTRRKADLLDSRVRATETLVRAIDRLDTSRRPRTLVNASGIDFYGDRSDEVLTEGSGPGDTFLTRLCQRWERAATAAQTLGVRVVLMRTAVVLAPDAPTMHLMSWPFRLCIGGPLGDGRQWFTWIHIDDVVGLYKVANAHGYEFRSPELETALRNCLQRGHAERTTLLSMGSHSPFFPVLGGAIEDMPEVLSDQYLVRPGDNYRVVLEGTMDRIWHRPFWLWPFFRLLAAFDILFPEQGSNVVGSMIVEGLHDGQGGGAQTWRRTFEFRRPRRFDATMAFDFRLARVVERMGPFGVLEVVWNVTFEPPATIRIVTEGIRFGVGRCRIALPRWAAMEVRVSETALGDRSDTIAVDLAVRQPWLGEIFGYAGRFQVRREVKEGRGS